MLLSAKYYSQPATQQDRWVISKSGGKRGGFFIEIGAHDGLRHSNTATLERYYGWKGLLVEPNHDLYCRLCENRPDAHKIEIAIGPETDDAQLFTLGDSFSGLCAYMPLEWITEHQRRGNRIVEVETITLRRLLDGTRCPTTIDYLSLDVEGAEYPILEKFFKDGDSATYSFRYMTVEFRYEHSLLRNLIELMEPAGYELDEVRAFDACFVNTRIA